jgi:hypothetical protein
MEFDFDNDEAIPSGGAIVWGGAAFLISVAILVGIWVY